MAARELALLQEHLSAAEFAAWERERALTFVGSDGNMYRVEGDSSTIWEDRKGWFGRTQKVRHCCVSALGSWPEIALANILLLRSDAALFKRLANTWPYSG